MYYRTIILFQVIEHLTGKKLPTEGVYLQNFSDYIKQHAGEEFRLLELKLFSGRSIRQLRKQSKRAQKIQLQQGRPNITQKIFHKIPDHRLFERGSGLMIVRFSTDFCQRKRHLCLLNLNSMYMYDGGDKFLPFQKNMVREEHTRVSLLKSFGIKCLTEVYLVTSTTSSKGKRMGNMVIQSPYGNIDISHNEIITQIPRTDLLQNQFSTHV